MPVTVAVDAGGTSVHRPVRASGRRRSARFPWRRMSGDGEATRQRREGKQCAAASGEFGTASRLAPRASQFQWRASPHCRVVNLVRSGRKQPQLFSASAGGKARHPYRCAARRDRACAGRMRTSETAVTLALARKWRPQDLRRNGRAGARGAGADQCAHAEPPAPRLPADRHARRGQDHARADHRQGAQLRDRRHRHAVRRLRGLQRDRRGPLRRPDRAGRRLQHPGRPDARAAGERAVRADPRRASRCTSSTKCTCCRARRSTPC